MPESKQLEPKNSAEKTLGSGVPRKLVIWNEGFDAGLFGTLDNPTHPDLDDRLLWRAAWMAARKCFLVFKPVMDEHEHQVMLFRWADSALHLCPELALMLAIPNAGKRTATAGGRMKAEGLKPGAPDVLLLVPRRVWGCLAIEMKSAKGVLSELQKQWLRALNEQNNCAQVCRSWVEARDTVLAYLYGGCDAK